MPPRDVGAVAIDEIICRTLSAHSSAVGASNDPHALTIQLDSENRA